MRTRIIRNKLLLHSPFLRFIFSLKTDFVEIFEPIFERSDYYKRQGCTNSGRNENLFDNGCFLLWSASLKEKFRGRERESRNRTICNQNTFEMNIPYSYNALKRVIISKLMNGVKLGEFQWGNLSIEIYETGLLSFALYTGIPQCGNKYFQTIKL